MQGNPKWGGLSRSDFEKLHPDTTKAAAASSKRVRVASDGDHPEHGDVVVLREGGEVENIPAGGWHDVDET